MNIHPLKTNYTKHHHHQYTQVQNFITQAYSQQTLATLITFNFYLTKRGNSTLWTNFPHRPLLHCHRGVIIMRINSHLTIKHHPNMNALKKVI